MKDIFINVPLSPVPASRPKVTRQGFVYYGKSHQQFQKDVRKLFDTNTLRSRKCPLTVPVIVNLRCYVPIAKSTSQKKKQEMDNTPCLKYDNDNVEKLVWDEILTGNYIKDDKQIWSNCTEMRWTSKPVGWIEIDIYVD